MKNTFALLPALIFLLSHISVFAQTPSGFSLPEEELWYKNSVIYNLDIDAFMDANNDGMGDFQGLIEHLDYLKALGVDVIWLAPFQPSPGEDNGYDISNYYDVNPAFGNGGDFAAFMEQAEKLNIRVITDLVINHTSDQHPWFQQARADTASRYHDWYIWSSERPKDWNRGMVFPGVQKETWTYDSTAQQYYYHRFYRFQPELNMDNPEVQQELRKVIGFWLNAGVAGFRLDAVPFIIEETKPGEEAPPHDFQKIKDIRGYMQWHKGDAAVLGEANVLPDETIPYFGESGDGIQMMFNFYVNQHMFYALASGDTQPLAEALQATRNIPRTAQWAHFLRNHDELDLGRLTDEQRKKVYQKFGPEPEMQLYDRGIRRRLPPMLGDPNQLRMATSLIFSLPGAPVIRYGDEIGMGDDLDLKEREAVRTPMQWSDEKNGGFSQADSLIRPVIDEGPYGYQSVNVEEQMNAPNSLLSWTTDLIHLRKAHPEIGLGTWEILDTGKPGTLTMKYAWENHHLLVVHNFKDQPQQLTLPAGESHTLIDLWEDQEIASGSKKQFAIDMPAYGYRWFSIE